jgi:asparagine synthase (glutamine-hydrolysing)
LARDGGLLGYGDRTTAMRRIFAELLPNKLLARPDKAAFDELFWGPQTMRFARNWDGTGLDSSLVDQTVLRRCWETRDWPGASALAVQQAWLVTDS